METAGCRLSLLIDDGPVIDSKASEMPGGFMRECVHLAVGLLAGAAFAEPAHFILNRVQSPNRRPTNPEVNEYVRSDSHRGQQRATRQSDDVERFNRHANSSSRVVGHRATKSARRTLPLIIARKLAFVQQIALFFGRLRGLFSVCHPLFSDVYEVRLRIVRTDFVPPARFFGLYRPRSNSPSLLDQGTFKHPRSVA
jgi:hypothetical protein